MDITTSDGQMSTCIWHLERSGPYPTMGVLMAADGIREESQDMARRLATVGDDVWLPNLYEHERGQRSSHARTARVAEPADEDLAHWTTAPRMLMTVTPKHMRTRVAGNWYARVTSEAISPPPV
jgi:dienelactone hydrolase